MKRYTCPHRISGHIDSGVSCYQYEPDPVAIKVMGEIPMPPSWKQWKSLLLVCIICAVFIGVSAGIIFIGAAAPVNAPVDLFVHPAHPAPTVDAGANTPAGATPPPIPTPSPSPSPSPSPEPTQAPGGAGTPPTVSPPSPAPAPAGGNDTPDTDRDRGDTFNPVG